MRRIAAAIPTHVRFRPRICGFRPSNASLGSPEDHRPRGGMDSSADFPRAEKRRRHCWRERVGNAGASFVWRRLPPPDHSKEHPINGLLYAGEKRASEWTNSGIEAARMTHSRV